MKKWLLLSVIFIWGCEDASLDILDIEEETILSIEIEETDPLDQELIAWYSFDNNTNDSSINELHGILYKGEYGTCRSNQEFSSLQLDVDDSPSWGKENDRVEIEYDPIMDVSNITISSWVNIQDKPSPYDGRSYSIASRWFTNYTDEEAEKGCFSFYIDNDRYLAFTDRNQNITADQSPIPNDEWVHIVVTIDDEKLRFYVNGGFIYEEILNENFKLPVNTLDLLLGERQMYNGYWYHFEGKLDDVGIWGRALSACEVLDIYNK